MSRTLRTLRLAALVAFVGSSVAVAQTSSGSTGAAGGPAATPGAGGMAGGQGASGAARKSGLSRADEGFLTQAAQNGHAEVEASKLAMEKASDPKVKEFARKMVEDHTQANQELEKLASSKGVDLPDGPSLLQKGKSKLMLSTADGESFDRRYADSMGVEAHEDNIELFEEAVKEAEDAEVKAYAQKVLPKLQEHLKMAKQLADSLPKK